jgi:hypothetical protein
MQKAVIGSAPKPIQLYRQGHKGSDPENPDAMCSQVTEDRLVSCS